MRLNIEKLIYGGDGLARLPAGPSDKEARGSGKAVFIPFVLSGEKVEAALTEEKSGFARARATAIVEPSPHRVDPACPYFARCGGCHYQHAAYEQQLEIKKEILHENLRRIAKLELECEIQAHPSPPWNYRNRSRLQVRTRPEFAIGYCKFASHEVLPVRECPISSPLINRGIAALWEAGRVVEGVREVEFFANADDTQLLIEVLCAPEARRAAVRVWAEEFCVGMAEVVGVAAFRETQKGVQERLVTIGASELVYNVKNVGYRVSAGAFFQTNRFLLEELVDIVTAGRSGDLALDLYAGVGLFSTALACDVRHIVSVESSQTAASDLAYNLPVNGKAVHAEAGKYLAHVSEVGTSGDGTREDESSAWLRAGFSAQPHSDAKTERVGKGPLPQVLQKPDLVVVDPPRSGLGERVTGALARLGAPRITYVSCDPSTSARDLMGLQSAGYRVEEAHLLDLFPQTYHLESVLQLVRG